MDDVGGRFQRINECILRIKGRSVAGLDPLLMQLQGDVLALRQSYETTINATATHEQKVADLKKRLEELASPPLVHALLIGPSAREPDTFVVSVGGQRMDVKAASTDGGELHLERLREGTEVLVTRESTAIVGVVGPGQRGDAAEVRDVLDDAVTGKPNRLLVRWGGTDGIVVDMAQSLRTQGEDEAGELPKAGDRVLIDPSARMAFEKLKPESASEAELETDPHDTYEDIAGLDEKIESIRDAIELPYIHRALFERYQLEPPKGILLHGPPGCGKTMIGRAVANGLKKRIVDQIDALIARIRALPDVPADARDAVRTAIVDEAHQMSVAVDLSKPQQAVARLETAKHDVCSYFLNIKGPELLSKWVGEAEHRIRRLFAEARRKASYRQPVIVFFDEIESMFQRRGSGVSSDMEKTMVPQLLTELDGLERLQNVVVIGASNRHELLDPALLRPGRLDVKIKIDRPDRAGAAAIFRRYLQPPGSHQLKLSPHGLLDSSRSAFDGEIGQIIKSLGEAATFVRVQRDRGEPALARLDVALPADLFDEVAAALRGGNAGYRDGAIKTRIGYADLSRAIGAVCRTHSARLVAERRLPADVKAIDVMFRLDAIDAIERHRFPPLPFVSAGAVDAGDSQALAALLIDISVDALFSPRSQLKARVIAKCGREHSFLLREFVSGALISNIVSRAKRSALKRATRPDSPDGGDGITSQDLLLAVREEYEENKDQFVANKPEVATTICEVCKREHSGADEYDIEVVLGRSPRSRWHEPRRPPHERGRPSQMAEAVGGTR